MYSWYLCTHKDTDVLSVLVYNNDSFFINLSCFNMWNTDTVFYDTCN